MRTFFFQDVEKVPPHILDTLLRRGDFFPRVLGSLPWLFSLLLSILHIPRLPFFAFFLLITCLALYMLSSTEGVFLPVAALGNSRSSLPAVLSCI